MVKNGSPQTGDVYLKFNGRDSYVEIPSIADYGASTTGDDCCMDQARYAELPLCRKELGLYSLAWQRRKIGCCRESGVGSPNV